MTADRTTFDRRWWLVLAGVFALALGLRAAYVAEIRDVGFFREHLSDAAVYMDRAAGIAAGDWFGPADFVHAPSYAYLLGVLQSVGGDSPWLPRIVQAVIGALTCVVVALIARRLFDPTTGAVAGGLLALYPPAIFFDGLIQKASLTLLLSTLLLYLMLLATARPRWWRWALVGIVGGALVLTRQNMLALLPLLAVWFVVALRGQPIRRRVIWTATAAAALLITMAPWVLRNRAILGDYVLTTPNLGQNLAMGNHPDATGTYLPHVRGQASGEREQAAWRRTAERAMGRPLTATEVSNYYVAAAWQWIRANPAAWLRLTAYKVALTWGAYELPDTEDYYLYAEHARILATTDTLWHFGILAPLAAGGILLTRQHWRCLWPLYAWLIVVTLAIALFVVFARYRLPLVPALICFAAAGIVTGMRCLRQRHWRPVLGGLVVIVLVGVACNYPVGYERRPYPQSFVNHAIALANQGRYDAALAETQRAIDLAPRNVNAHHTAGSILLDMNRHADALTHFEQARAGDPNYIATLRGIGDAQLGLGHVPAAAAAYEAALQRDPHDAVTLTGLASVLAQQGRHIVALELIERAIDRRPSYADAHLNHGNLLLVLGQADDAAAAYERALALRPDYADAHFNLGVLALQRGDVDGAIARFRATLHHAPMRQDAQHNLVYALMTAGQREAALQAITDWLATDPQRADLRTLKRQIEEHSPTAP